MTMAKIGAAYVFRIAVNGVFVFTPYSIIVGICYIHTPWV
jgi:hypothetical protein